ncbi:hypothetical protein TNCV_2040051 [Trichonephila clavipes]|nr:hypothetical protein TNCV_2040051 [Trichonephila clavipes]
MLPVLGKKAVLEWCMKEGLIESLYVCPKCEKSMELRERTETRNNPLIGCSTQISVKTPSLPSIDFVQRHSTTDFNVFGVFPMRRS